MRIKATQEELAPALQTSLRAVSNQSTLPILTGVKIKAKDGKIWFSTTNLEIYIQRRISGDVLEPGEVVLPARLISDIVRSLPDGEIELAFIQEENQVKVSCRDLNYSVNTLEATDFPEVPVPEKRGSEMKVEGQVFQEIVRQVAPAASADGSRPVLTGALMSVHGQSMKMVTTDSYRLAVREIKLGDTPNPDFQVIVPSRSVEEASKIMDGGEMKILLSERLGVFDAGETILVTRLIDGAFPNYKQLLPDSVKHKIGVDKGELANALKRVALISGFEAPVTLRFTEETLTITTVHDAQQAEARIKLQSKGPQFEICFNPKFLLDGLASIKEDMVTLELESPEKPALLRGSGNGFVYLIMPVRLK